METPTKRPRDIQHWLKACHRPIETSILHRKYIGNATHPFHFQLHTSSEPNIHTPPISFLKIKFDHLGKRSSSLKALDF